MVIVNNIEDNVDLWVPFLSYHGKCSRSPVYDDLCSE